MRVQLLNKLSVHKKVNVAIITKFCNAGFTLKIDEYEYDSTEDSITFGNEDQDICINKISEKKIVEDKDEFVIEGDNKEIIMLFFT